MCLHSWIHLELAEDHRAAHGLADRRGRVSREPEDGPLLQRLRGALAKVVPDRRRVPGPDPHFAHRENDGLTVDLYWEHDPCRDVFRVEVVDRREEQRLTLHASTGRAALEAFYHPFCT
jgi:hypothetical protein